MLITTCECEICVSISKLKILPFTSGVFDFERQDVSGICRHIERHLHCMTFGDDFDEYF